MKYLIDFIMGKNFTKTMSFDDFRTMVEKAPKSKLETFLDLSNKMNKLAVEYNHVRNEVVKEFLSKRERFLFVYEHLPNDDGSNFSISERANMMKTAEHWTISNVEGKYEIIISFLNGNKYTSTLPISIHEFKTFMGED